MLLDRYAPHPDASELHRIEIDAAPARVWQALHEADLADSFVIRALMGLRSLPKRILGANGASPPAKLDLAALLRVGFGKLAEDPGREIVIGVNGRFWRPVDNLLPFRREDFDEPVAAGTARGVWNFHVAAIGANRSLLTTETRVVCGDAASRWKFRAYWMLIRPFSGWIRIIMLRQIARSLR